MRLNPVGLGHLLLDSFICILSRLSFRQLGVRPYDKALLSPVSCLVIASRITSEPPARKSPKLCQEKYAKELESLHTTQSIRVTRIGPSEKSKHQSEKNQKNLSQLEHIS